MNSSRTDLIDGRLKTGEQVQIVRIEGMLATQGSQAAIKFVVPPLHRRLTYLVLHVNLARMTDHVLNLPDDTRMLDVVRQGLAKNSIMWRLIAMKCFDPFEINHFY